MLSTLRDARRTDRCLLATAAAVLFIAVAGCGGVSKNEMIERAKMRAQINQAQAQADELAEPDLAEPPPATQSEDPAVAAAQPESKPEPSTPAAPTTESPTPRVASADASPAAAATNPQPRVRLDPREETLQSAAKLKRIGRAVLEYVKTNKRFPPQGRDGLSWRVHILPQLGYEQLFEQFQLKQPWDSPHNLALVDQMPDAFLLPGRNGTRTVYFSIKGPGALYNRPIDQPSILSLGDNAGKTLILVEGDEANAVGWTEPVDYPFNREAPGEGLGGMRQGAPLACWADGKVTRLNLNAPKQQLEIAFRLFPDDEDKRLNLASLTRPVDEPDAVVADSSPGAPASRATPGSTPGARPTTPGASRPYSELAQQYLSAAKAAYAHGDRVDAWKWFSGAIVAGLPASEWEKDFRWVDGLRRPTLGLHIAVAALSDVDTPSDRGRGRAPSEQDDIRNELLQASYPSGQPLLDLLEEHAAACTPAALQSEDTPLARPGETPATISYLTVSTSLGEIRREAEESGCDVLALFRIDNSSTRRYRSVEVLLYDFRRSRVGELLEGRKVTASLDSPVMDDQTVERMQEAKWQLKDYLEDHLTPGDFPVKLTKDIAARRVAALGLEKTDQPLPVLIEMRYYRDHRLVDDVVMLKAMSDLVGSDQGPQLLLGSDLKKRRVLRYWLPSDDPAAVVSLADRRRRVEQDIDD